MTAALELRHARVRYGPLEALHGVTLAAPGPGLTVLLGRNGSGRTTVLRALAGTVPLSGGAVFWDGADVTPRAGVRAGPPRTVSGPRTAGGVRLPHRAREPRTRRPGTRPRPWTPTRSCAPLLGRRAGTLSGGEQRMLALSRALLARARVVLVDEPAQGMSPAVAARTYTLLAALDACVVVAEQRLPPLLQGRPAVVVTNCAAGRWCSAERRASSGSGKGRPEQGRGHGPRRGPSPSG